LEGLNGAQLDWDDELGLSADVILRTDSHPAPGINISPLRPGRNAIVDVQSTSTRSECTVWHSTVQTAKSSVYSKPSRLFFSCPGYRIPICNEKGYWYRQKVQRVTYLAIQTFKQHEYKSRYREKRVHRVQRAPDHHQPSFGPAMMTLYIATTSALTVSILHHKPHYRTGLRAGKVRLNTHWHRIHYGEQPPIQLN
jgi:hypothetical protein